MLLPKVAESHSYSFWLCALVVRATGCGDVCVRNESLSLLQSAAGRHVSRHPHRLYRAQAQSTSSKA